MTSKTESATLLIEKMRGEKGPDGRSKGEYARDDAQDMRESSPAAVLVNTALAINWKWRPHAESRIEYFKEKHPDVTGFNDLKRLIDSMSADQFCREVLNLNISTPANPKYKMLKHLVEAFLDYKKKNNLTDDWEALRRWGERVNVIDITKDPIVVGRSGIGLATIQNIKIVSGFDTSKPDRRIVNVLERRFKMDLGNSQSKLPKAVQAIEELSRLTGHSCIELDQLFWYWVDQHPKFD